jgi:hypothetical protein
MGRSGHLSYNRLNFDGAGARHGVGVGASLGPSCSPPSHALEDAAYDPEVQAFDRYRSFGQSAVAGALTG